MAGGRRRVRALKTHWFWALFVRAGL